MLYGFYDLWVGNKDYTISFKDLVKKHGFDFESYKVITGDGYINEVYRLRTEETKAKPCPAVLLNHGICDSAFSWVKHYPEVSPAFVLARQGFDVWLSN